MPKRSNTDSTKSTTWVQNKLGKLKVGQTFDLKFLQGIVTLKVEKHSDVLVLAIVQFKGGVGKSTTAFELAEMFRTQYGWNVLLVDSDAQRHSSCMLLRDDTLEERKEVDESDSDDSSDEESKQQEPVKLERPDSVDTTEYHGIASVLHGMTDTIQHGTIPAMPGPVNYTGASRYQYAFSSFTQQEERSLFEVLRGGYWPNPTVRVNDINTYPQPIELDLDNYGNDKCGKMWIIPGDVRMKLIDEALTTADTHSKILRWGLLGWIMREFAVKYDCRVVIVDTAPADSNYNAMIVKSCDAIIPPCFPDNNSVHSLRDLMLRVLPSWHQQWTKRLSAQSSDEERDSRHSYNQLLMSNKLPYILPVVVSNYQRRKVNGKFRDELDELSTLFTERLEMVMAGQEPDIDGNSRKLPIEIQNMMYPFGSTSNPQRVVRLIAHSAELARWSQLEGRSMTAWARNEQDEVGLYIEYQLMQYVGRLIAFYQLRQNGMVQ